MRLDWNINYGYGSIKMSSKSTLAFFGDLFSAPSLPLSSLAPSIENLTKEKQKEENPVSVLSQSVIDDYLAYKELQESLTTVECLLRISQANDAIKTRVDSIEDLRKHLQVIKKAYEELTKLKAGAELTEIEAIGEGLGLREAVRG